MSLSFAYFLLAVSIGSEMIAAGFLTATHGFTRLKPSLICVLSYIVSFFCFGHCLSVINLGVGYATWGAVGTVITTLIGVLIYKQKITKIGVVSLALIVICIAAFNLFG